MNDFDRSMARIFIFAAGMLLIVVLAAYGTRQGDEHPSPTPTSPHPRVMEATRPLVVYTVERPAPRARLWAIEERAAWYERPQEAAQPPVVAQPVPEATPQPEAPPVAVQEPTPIVIPATERDHMAGLTRDDVRAAARAAGWPEGQIETVVRVAECESGLRPWEVGAAGEVGVLQIHPIHRELHAKYDLRDPVQNMLAALEVWQASGWSAWSCH